MTSFFTSARRALRQPAFLIVAVILLGCAVTLNSVVAFMAVHFKKIPLAMRVHSLREGIPHTLEILPDKDHPDKEFPNGIRWVMVSVDHPIDADIEHTLLTSEYIFRDYVDAHEVSADDIRYLKDASEDERNHKLMELRQSKPAAVIRMAVTYYTGLVDTVAHVPERCFVSDGFEISSSENEQASLACADGKTRDIEYRFLGFEDQAVVGLEMPRVARNVAYFFHCNGGYTSSSMVVRRRLQDLFEPYGYYAKVELMTAATLIPGREHALIQPNSPDATRKAMRGFLRAALPEIEKCLPDWDALHAKKK
jgi:hypothetical protein